LIAIEILSPRQALSHLTDKAFKQYFPAGVKVVWMIIPVFRLIQIVLPNGDSKSLASHEIIKDPVTGIEIDLKTIFR